MWPPDIEKQAELILALVRGHSGKAWASDREGWSKSVYVCDWDGIECDEGDKTVIGISVDGSDLATTIPTEFGLLLSLKSIDLSENIIYGSIPTQVANLPALEYFDASENKLTGTIPPFLSKQLTEFDVSRNMLTGSIPNNVGLAHPDMVSYDVMHNSLDGTLPNTFREMNQLNTLSISENSIFGTIPPHLGDLQGLKYLYLDNNNLVGPIPANLARPQYQTVEGSAMKELWLHENMLSGTVPAALADLDKLVNLYIDGNKFTGSVPLALCRETINEDFFENVKDNITNYCDSIACPVNAAAFEGVYPCTACESVFYNPYLGRVGKCIDLDERSILEKFYESTSQAGHWNGQNNWDEMEDDHCEFSGVTCDAQGNVLGIRLKGRGLKGTIPEEIGFLEYLEVLDLSDNHLVGFLPSDLRWAPLRRLDISGNRLRGIVPPLLCLKAGVNNNGDDGDYNCEKVACPAGTFSPTGRESTTGDMCMPCMDNDAKFLGSKNCESWAIAKPMGKPSESNAGGSGGVRVGLVVFLGLMLGTLVLSIIAAAQLRKKNHRDELPQEEEEELYSDAEEERPGQGTRAHLNAEVL